MKRIGKSLNIKHGSSEHHYVIHGTFHDGKVAAVQISSPVIYSDLSESDQREFVFDVLRESEMLGDMHPSAPITVRHFGSNERRAESFYQHLVSDSLRYYVFIGYEQKTHVVLHFASHTDLTTLDTRSKADFVREIVSESSFSTSIDLSKGFHLEVCESPEAADDLYKSLCTAYQAGGWDAVEAAKKRLEGKRFADLN